MVREGAVEEMKEMRKRKKVKKEKGRRRCVGNEREKKSHTDAFIAEYRCSISRRTGETETVL